MNRTKRLLRVVIPVAAITCILIFAPVQAFWIWITRLPKSVQEQVHDAANHGLDGLIVYVDQKGKASELYAAGWKDRKNEIPADPHALFKIASMSKLYIAAATAKLISNKRLSADKTLADYLPDMAGRIENADKITLRMLLQHRSGIPNFINDPRFPWANQTVNLDDALKLVLDKPADFKPDSRFEYSNTNYLLIGMILDKTLGYHHQQYIKREILEPLGLKHTYASLSDIDSGQMVSGYMDGYKDRVMKQNFEIPGGSMVATAEDVGIFLRALSDGSLLKPDEMTIYSSIYEYGHTGLLPGYSSIARYYKDIDTVVVLFVNTSGGNSWTTVETVYNRIIRIVRKR